MLGFFLFGLTMTLISQWGRKKQLEFYQSLLDALRRIASGDFKVMLPLPGMWDDFRMGSLVEVINEMAADLGEMEIMRQEFISNVSHEIQSPLTSISGFARVLKDGDLSAAQRDYYLDIIEQESIRLSRLSDNMLKLASLDSEHHPFHPALFRLDKQLRQVIVVCEPLWSAKSIEVIAELQSVETKGISTFWDRSGRTFFTTPSNSLLRTAKF